MYNLFGTVGSHLSRYLFYILGFSSLWLVVIFLIMSVLSFQGRSLLPPVRSIIAILCLVISFSGIMSLQLEGDITFRGGELQSGGIVGYYVSDFIKDFLNFFGANVFLIAVFVISLMICTHIHSDGFSQNVPLDFGPDKTFQGI